MTFSPWPHQIRGTNGVKAAIEAGHRSICLTAPTGAGKTWMMNHAIQWGAIKQEWDTVLYTHRKMLLSQTSKSLFGWEIDHGVLASGWRPNDSQRVQLAMMQTVAARGTLPRAKLVLVDEAHGMVGEQAETILRGHMEAGSHVVGFTATPLDIGHVYKHLVVAGTNSELRKCGAHVPCHTYAPDEPDSKGLKAQANGEFTEKDVVKRMMTSIIFGRVYEHWKTLNPNGLPTLLFAPGVKESKWFVDEFVKQGVNAAHIDGEVIYYQGAERPSNQDNRDEIADLSRDGIIDIVCNRFVLREGIDWPWIGHGIFATMFGSLTGYLQSGGRLLRSYPGLDKVVLQDHGGNHHRHGSLNADRHWELGQTNAQVVGERIEKMREKEIQEPIRCVQCAMVIAGERAGLPCPNCGYKFSPHSKRRPVIQLDGTLKMVKGDIYKKRVVRQVPDTERKWVECYHRCKKATKRPMSFAQARALFFKEHHYYPPEGLPYMPAHKADWKRKINAPNVELCTTNHSGANG